MRPPSWAVVLAVCTIGTMASAGDSKPACSGLSAAVLARDSARLKSVLATGCDPKKYGGGTNPLELALAFANVEAVKALLEAGADPNSKALDGSPVVSRLASGQHVSDDDALEVAKLLEQHRCSFDASPAARGPDLVTNLATRHLPKTLAFLASKKSLTIGLGPALKAVARGDDLETIRALLQAGADPLEGAARSSPLLEAAAAGRTASVGLMLSSVNDKSAEKVIAAYDAAVRKGYAETARAFVDAGVRPPAPVAPARSLCVARELTGDEAELLARATGRRGATRCKFVQRCGELVFVDCNSAADGPSYYINQSTSTLVSTCGGACMRGCTNCPPPAWSCSCNP